MNVTNLSIPCPAELGVLAALLNRLADSRAAIGAALPPATGADEMASFVAILRANAKDPEAYWIRNTRQPRVPGTRLPVTVPCPTRPEGIYGASIAAALSGQAAVVCCEAVRDGFLASGTVRRNLARWFLRHGADDSILLNMAELEEGEAAHLQTWVDHLNRVGAAGAGAASAANGGSPTDKA